MRSTSAAAADTCRLPFCGDAVRLTGEGCDDGGNDEGGCAAVTGSVGWLLALLLAWRRRSRCTQPLARRDR